MHSTARKETKPLRQSTVATLMIAALYMPAPALFVAHLHYADMNVRPLIDDLWILIQFWCFIPGIPWLLFRALDPHDEKDRTW